MRILSEFRMFKQIVRRYANRSCDKPKTKCSKKDGERAKGKPLTGCVVGPSGVHPVTEGGYKGWRALTFFVCFPLIGLAAYNTFANHEEPPRVPFAKYEYMRRRTKPFFWGDGGPTDKSFFHNPRVNALSDGYEEIEEEEEGEGEE